MTGTNKKAIQDLVGSENHCHGCGPENSQGLQIKSYIEGDSAICHFKAKPHHSAGAESILNGGILASVVDCHSVNFAMARQYQLEGREIGSEPKIWCVTATLELQYLKPTPIDTTLKVVATIEKEEGRKTWLRCSVFANEVETVRGSILAVRLKEDVR